MQTLQTLYEANFKNSLFFDRKITIGSKKTILHGPRKSGKSHLIIDHLSHYEKGSYLYIDFSDDRIEPHLVAENLPLFLQKNRIQLLVIEHFDFSFDLPKVEEILITTTFTCKTLQGYEELTLYPLDFEEFISFDKKHSNIEHLFNLFANNGTFPQIVQSVEQDYQRQMQSMLHLILNDATTFLIYKRLCELQSTKVSLFQIYNHLKAFTKISKDKLYAITAELIDQKLLFFVEKYNQPSSSKKVYPIDFALKDALTFKKDFLKRFENMVFLELIKRGKKVYYEEGIDFYLPEESLAILCVGFATTEAIEIKLQKLLPTFWSLHVKRIEVVTLSSESAKDIEGFSFSIAPFWEWSLQL
ncbi:ATP-binding protein [Sulfurospirillum oryzae]|uniref:ATP-binding protein n=1 Tax=Sulfurospirillum oryzae TaxID=2976535 RepID=UPI0021E8D11F|nr:ATP-binding protein [Sulfurospirillum oryzae]